MFGWVVASTKHDSEFFSFFFSLHFLQTLSHKKITPSDVESAWCFFCLFCVCNPGRVDSGVVADLLRFQRAPGYLDEQEFDLWWKVEL